VTKDPFRTDGSLQVVAPIESISGPPVASPKQRATPVYVRNTVSSRFLGYLNIGLLSNDLNSLSNPNFTNSRSPRVYPVANDVWIANNPTNLRVGPRYKLSNGANYVNPPLVPGIAINAGDLVTIGGDVAITSNGLSIWAPISAVAAKTQ
jgi:hypothetical protein